MICDTGLDLNACYNQQGYNVLTYSALIGMDDIVNYLTLRKCDIDAEDPESLTVLARYALASNFDMVKRLIKRGANLDYTNSEGKTALVLCVDKGREESIAFLL